MSFCKGCNAPLENDAYNILCGGEEDMCEVCIAASDPVMTSAEWSEAVLEFVEDTDDEILDELDLGGC